jgi:hypothetical protein
VAGSQEYSASCFLPKAYLGVDRRAARAKYFPIIRIDAHASRHCTKA